MQNQGTEIYFVILAGTVLALSLVGFILLIFLLYARKRQKQEQAIVLLREQYEQEVLRSQLEMQESTMKAIAQELHDNIGQTLSVIKLWMSVAPIDAAHEAYEGIQNSKDMLNKVIYDMADLTKSLHTDRIAEIGLVEAIRFDLASITKTGLITVNFECRGEEYSFAEQKSIVLFRMYQEMMNNILKHSKAKKVNVTADYSPEFTFVLTIEDNGIGFDLHQKRDNANSSSGLGLKSMRNRAKLIGAEINMQSELGKGTKMSVSVPLDEN